MESDYNSAKSYLKEEHYYGMHVRKLFIFAGLIMLVSLPIFSDMIPFGMTWSIVSIILVIFGAGILNPLVRWVTVFNLIISFLATVIFEYQAVVSYRNIYSNLDTGFFVVNQVLALMFLISAYYGAKSMRGFLVKGKIVS
jgi:hypothetical protein